MVAGAAQPTPGPAEQGFPRPTKAQERVFTAAQGEPDHPAPGHEAAGERPEGLIQSLQSLLQELPALVSDRVDLLSLELRRAGRALTQIVMLVVAGAILGITGWLVLWGAIVVALVSLGLPLAVTLFAALAINVGAAVWALLRVRKLLPSLGLPATRRHLMISPSPLPATGAPDPAAP